MNIFQIRKQPTPAPDTMKVLRERTTEEELSERYKPERVLGKGSFGTVLLAHETQPPHRKVAIKFFENKLEWKQEVRAFEGTAQKLRFWVPSLRSAAGYLQR